VRLRGRRIEKGRVLGVHHRVQAVHPGTGRPVCSFVLKMAYGLPDAHDSIRIDGDPPVKLRFEGGLSGDRATVGCVLSAIRTIADAPPGISTRVGLRHSTRKR
jgi:4-hydroxy-tetrahydrodipicolinate reductase